MRFQLKVVRTGTLPLMMQLDAASDLEARRLAEQQGYTVLRVNGRHGVLAPRMSRFPLLFFCQELYVLLDAGLTLPEAIATLEKKEKQAETRASLHTLGIGLSDSVAHLIAGPPTFFQRPGQDFGHGAVERFAGRGDEGG